MIQPFDEGSSLRISIVLLQHVSINDVIIYGTQGVCKILGEEEKTIGGSKKLYFILKPVIEKADLQVCFSYAGQPPAAVRLISGR